MILNGCLKHVPVYDKGTFEEIDKISINFNSIIPELLGLDNLQNNLC